VGNARRDVLKAAEILARHHRVLEPEAVPERPTRITVIIAERGAAPPDGPGAELPAIHAGERAH
jgi:hypothetical protein